MESNTGTAAKAPLKTLKPWQLIANHPVFPEATHDEAERYNFLMNFNRFLSTDVAPAVRMAYEKRVKPRFTAAMGRAPKDRHEIRQAMKADPYYQVWSALRRDYMEQRQQAGRSLVLRQIDQLNDKVAKLNASAADTLELHPDVKLPVYLAEVDHHCMPGSYHTELVANDASAAANYDSGLYVTTCGALGSLTDGGGRAVADFVKETFPHFQPKRILDLGAGLGHNVVPIALAFPEAEVIAVDTAAPMLRYGHARAQSLGAKNIRFVQADCEHLPYADESFDWIQTTMFWHETSMKGMRRMFEESFRMLKKGGLVLHVEQPQYKDPMDLFEQFQRDWDAYYNNEPFWSKMHEVDVLQMMEDVGFERENFVEGNVKAKPDLSIFPPSETGAHEDRGRAAAWYAFGAWKR